MKKVLIISYYWPPSGGAGVQRWLKLSKYLALQGIEVHILTVDEKVASYMQLDESLKHDIHPSIQIHKTTSFEPINYYSQLVGKKNVPTAGFSNVNNESKVQQLVNAIRSNFFIPDPRVGWKKYAVRKGKEIIQQYGIQTVITTSPPHSTQLIGRDLKKAFPKLKWIVDFRDPWTDIYYYSLLGHTQWSRRIDLKLEKEVIEQSDQIITVSQGFKDLFLPKSTKVNGDKFCIIPNGFDPEDLVPRQEQPNETFTICYTGTMSDQYEPESFLEGLRKVIDQNPNQPIQLQIVGSMSANIEQYIKKLQLPLAYIPSVPHSEIVHYQKNADLLLLLIPNINKGDGIVPGKLFEYLASQNPIVALASLSGDVAKTITNCQAGKTFDRSSSSEIAAFIEDQLTHFKNGTQTPTHPEKIKQYSRAHQAAQVAALIQ
ncbi:glycosyltransferase family 4 protein [bacterium]|nr:glycosyltransferase family 4 protein [bacterium]